MAATLWFAIPGMAQSGNFPGNPVSALVIDPATPTTLYVGTTNGVYKSTNGGVTWSGVKTGAAVSSLAIDPRATSTVYTPTATSTDGGATWTTLGSTGGGQSIIVVDPNATATVYVVGAGSLSSRSAFKSTDSGATWTEISNGLSQGLVHPTYASFDSLAIDPRTSTLFGGITEGGSFPHIRRRMGTEPAWRELFSTSFGTRFLDFAIDPANSPVLYAAASRPNLTGGSRGVFKSIDGGTSWSEKNTGLPFPQDATAIAIDPLNTSNLYVGLSSSIYKSVNGGASWAAATAGFPNGASINVLAVDPQTPSTVYAGTALGVYKSIDAGASWTATNNGLNTGLTLPPLALSSVSPQGASRDSIATITITGTEFVTPLGIDVGSGVAVTNVTRNSSTSITATLYVAPDTATGSRTLVVTGPNGISNSLPFTIASASVVPATLSGISPASLRQSGPDTTVDFTGTGFTPSLTVDAGSGITVSSVTVISSTLARALFSVAADALPGPRNLTVASSSGGSSNPATFTVLPGFPRLTEVSPSFVLAGRSAVVRLTGTFLTSPLTINTDADISVSDIVTDASGTSVTAVFTVAQNAVLGPHRVGVTAPGGTTTSAGGLTALVKSPTRQSDFNGDGKADLLWYYPPTGETVMWLMNGTSVLSYSSLALDPDWKVTATGDFSGDGRADLLWYNARTGQTSMWLMNGATVSSSALLFTDPYWKVTSTGDFNGDGKTDLLWSRAPSGETSMWWMNGTSRLSFFGLPAGPDFQVTSTGDFNEDNFKTGQGNGPIGFADVVGHNTATGETVGWITLGPGAWNSRSLNTDPNWKTTALPDLDGDGNSDLLWYNATTGQTNGWLLNGGAQPIDTPLLIDPDWKVTATADIDGDRKSDLIWYNAVTGQTVGWLMNGTAIANWAVLFTAPDWKVTSTGDFNGDDKIDLVWTNDATGQTVIWLMNGLAPSSYSLVLTDSYWRTFSPAR